MPVILCGDFNALPFSCTYLLLTEGSITRSNVCIFDSDVQFPDTLRLPEGICLHSAYKTCGTIEPDFTNYTHNFKGCIDYIFFHDDARHLQLLRVVPIDRDRYQDPLPNASHPSDHVPLVAHFDLS
eukprot:GILK01003044.1.p1 GENE.GILK01003044.1~~GILK01003044.1.p1  ORF type:complete len:126 (-),score=6.55 GILK01003044.1:221-598(-)